MNIETVSQRALELHEKASMPLNEALALAMREAAPGPIWPCAKLVIRDGQVSLQSHQYAPGLPDGEHDVYPLPVDANAAPFWCEQTETWLYKDESRKAFKNRPLDPQPPRPSQRFMVSSIKHKAGIVTLVTINAEDVLPPLESGQEVTLSPHGVAIPQDADPEKRPDFYTWTWDVEIGNGHWEARYGWRKPLGKVHNLQPLFTHGVQEVDCG